MLNSSSSQPLLVLQVLQALIHTLGPSLDLYQCGLLSLGPWNPGLLYSSPDVSSVVGKDDQNRLLFQNPVSKIKSPCAHALHTKIIFCPSS